MRRTGLSVLLRREMGAVRMPEPVLCSVDGQGRVQVMVRSAY